jgi:hypothetical protein
MEIKQKSMVSGLSRNGTNFPRLLLSLSSGKTLETTIAAWTLHCPYGLLSTI